MADFGPDVLRLREQEAERVMKENISVEAVVSTSYVKCLSGKYLPWRFGLMHRMVSRCPCAIFADRNYFLATDGAVIGRLSFLFRDDLLVFTFEKPRTQGGSHDRGVLRLFG
jgi:hypothetical protein